MPGERRASEWPSCGASPTWAGATPFGPMDKAGSRKRPLKKAALLSLYAASTRRSCARRPGGQRVLRVAVKGQSWHP